MQHKLLGSCACRKSIARKAGSGFAYGFVVGLCFVMAFFTLMSGLVMQGFTSTVEGKLTAGGVISLLPSQHMPCGAGATSLAAAAF